MIFVNCIGTVPPGEEISFFEVSNVAPISIFDPQLNIPDFNPDPEHPTPLQTINASQLIDFGQMRFVEFSTLFNRNKPISFTASGTYGTSSIFGSLDVHGSPSYVQARSNLLNVYGAFRYTPKQKKRIHLEAGMLYSQRKIDRLTVLNSENWTPLNTMTEQDDFQITLRGRYQFTTGDFGNLEAEATLLPFIKSNSLHFRLKYAVPLGIRQVGRYVKIKK